MNALQYHANLAALNAAGGQENIIANEPTPNPSELRAPSGNARGRVLSAGMLTIVFAVFFFGLIWALGNLTGETVFRRVEATV